MGAVRGGQGTFLVGMLRPVEGVDFMSGGAQVSWIGEAEGATPLERVFAQRPELLRRYKAFYASLWEGGVLPRRVLELCRLRIAAVHGCAQEWAVRDAGVHLSAAEAAALEAGECSCFTPSEQAALAVAEQFPFQHHEIDDAAVAEVQAAFGAKGAVALLTALAFFDVTCRWKLTLAVPAQPVALDRPPLHQGALA